MCQEVSSNRNGGGCLSSVYDQNLSCLGISANFLFLNNTNKVYSLFLALCRATVVVHVLIL